MTRDKDPRSRRHPHQAPSPPPADEHPRPFPEEGEPVAQFAGRGAEGVEGAGGALLEPAAEAVLRLEGELGEARTALAQATDKYLRLAAEFDNYKKRGVRERAEMRARAQADLLQRLIDALDDLARFAHVDPAQTDARTIHDGALLVERKLWKELDAVGVTRIDRAGVPFDPNVHEAVTMQPATVPEQDHTVGAVLQPGYKLGDALVRPARVVVLAWQEAATDGGEGDGSPRPTADN